MALDVKALIYLARGWTPTEIMAALLLADSADEHGAIIIPTVRLPFLLNATRGVKIKPALDYLSSAGLLSVKEEAGSTTICLLGGLLDATSARNRLDEASMKPLSRFDEASMKPLSSLDEASMRQNLSEKTQQNQQIDPLARPLLLSSLKRSDLKKDPKRRYDKRGGEPERRGDAQAAAPDIQPVPPKRRPRKKPPGQASMPFAAEPPDAAVNMFDPSVDGGIEDVRFLTPGFPVWSASWWVEQYRWTKATLEKNYPDFRLTIAGNEQDFPRCLLIMGWLNAKWPEMQARIADGRATNAKLMAMQWWRRLIHRLCVEEPISRQVLADLEVGYVESKRIFKRPIFDQQVRMRAEERNPTKPKEGASDEEEKPAVPWDQALGIVWEEAIPESVVDGGHAVEECAGADDF